MTSIDEIKGIVELGKDIVSPFSNSLSDTWNALIGDRISAWRLTNAMALQKELNCEASRLGLKLDRARIPDRYAFAWFEEATKQDEPEIQTLFARLLLRASSEEGGSADRRLIDILGKFSPTDAEIFRRVYSNVPFPDSGHYSEASAIGTQGVFGPDWPKDWALALLEQYHPGVVSSSLEHLTLIGCLGRTQKVDNWNKYANTPDLDPRRKGRQSFDDNDWKRMVKAFAESREYITATSLGSKLADAVRDGVVKR